jgi:hypothetical protein
VKETPFIDYIYVLIASKRVEPNLYEFKKSRLFTKKTYKNVSIKPIQVVSKRANLLTSVWFYFFSFQRIFQHLIR